jgi:hypothetical protein
MTPFFFEGGESVWLEALNALSMFALLLLPSLQRCGSCSILNPPWSTSSWTHQRVPNCFSFFSSKNHNPLNFNFAINSCRRIATTKSHSSVWARNKLERVVSILPRYLYLTFCFVLFGVSRSPHTTDDWWTC